MSRSSGVNDGAYQRSYLSSREANAQRSGRLLENRAPDTSDAERIDQAVDDAGMTPKSDRYAGLLKPAGVLLSLVSEDVEPTRHAPNRADEARGTAHDC